MRFSFFVCIIWCVLFTNSSIAQVVNLPCQTEVDGFLGLDRKDWNNGSTAFHSEGSLHNFDLPLSTGDCKIISNVQIDITVFNVDISGLTCPPPGGYYINIAAGCPSLAPASCNTANLIDEPNGPNFNSQSLSYNSPPEDFQFGENLSIDIVPVMDTNCLPNGQSALSSGEIILEFQICVTVTISDEIIDIPPDLGTSPTVCPSATTTLDPGSYTSYEWGPGGEITPTIDVGPGSYFVTVTDANGCTGVDDVMVLTHPTSSITFDPIAPTVCDDGFVNVSVNESYTSYEWSNSLSGQTVSLTTGTYQVTITDNNNCTFENSIIVSNVPPPNAGIDNFIDVCNDGTTSDLDALLTAHDPGGTWSDDDLSGVDVNINPMSVSFSGLSANSYDFTYTVSGNAPCPPDDATISVTVFEQSYAGTTNTVQYCPDPGNLDFNLLLDNPDAGGVWSDLSGLGLDLSNTFAVNFDGIPVGSYDFEYLHVMNGACAEQSAILTVVILVGESAGDDNSTTVCEGLPFNLETLINGATSGGVFVDTDASGALTGSLVNTIGLAGSSFDFTFIVGSMGSPCGTDEAVFTLTIESSVFAGTNVIESTCIGGDIDLYDLLTDEDAGGTFSDVNSSGGLIGNILTTDIITPGTYNYQYQIGDGVTCPVSTSNIEITFFQDPTFSFSQSEISICENQCNDIQIDFTGQAPHDFIIEVYSAATNELITASNLTTTTSNYIITTCNAVDSLTFMNDTLSLFSDSSYLITIPTLNDNNCDLSLTSMPDTLIVNTVSVTVVQIDSSACITDTVTIGGIQLFEGNAEYIDTLAGVSCDSIININVTFTDGDSIFIEPTLCDGDSILVRGIWYNEINSSDLINIDNPDGCDSLVSIEISFFPPATHIIDDQLCPGDSIIVNDVVYNESNQTGTETLIGQSVNGCDSIIDISLQFLGDITVIRDDTLCADESIIVGTVTFDSSNTTGQVILPGAGCDTIVDVDLSFHPIAISDLTGPFCSDYFITLNSNTYDFNNQTGTEILENASQFGCDSTININLTFYPDEEENIDGQFCDDYSITINSTTYDFNNRIGTEILENANQFGCDSTIKIDLSFYNQFEVPFIMAICANDSIDVNGTFYKEGNTTGTETFVAGSTNGCDSTVNVQLTILPIYEFTFEETKCEGDSIFAEGTWQFVAGTYTDIFQSIDLCDSIIITELTLNNCQTSVIVDMTNNDCAGEDEGTITLNIETQIAVPFTVMWNGANTGISGSQIISTSQNIINIDNLISDNYRIRILDSGGIIIYESTVLIIDTNTPISGTWVIIDSIFCEEDLATIEFQATGGQMPYEYNWSDPALGNQETAQDVMPGEYFLTVTDDIGCMFETTSLIVGGTDLFSASISVMSPLCAESMDGEIEITDITGGTLPYTITINGEVTEELIFSDLDSGIYVIELIDANNCMVTFTEEFTISTDPILGDYTLVHTITQGDSIVLDGNTTSGGDFMFAWSELIQTLSCTDCANPIANPRETTSYTLIITDESGCQETITIIVNVNELNVENVLPNVFSPNGDNNNDEFIFTNYNDELIDIEMSIYDRWGNKVYQNQSTENNIAWDGTKDGTELNNGVYVYSLRITKPGGQIETIFGDVLLIR